jgi:hypothetical protein
VHTRLWLASGVRRVILVLAGLVVFLAISAILARALSIDGAERSAITALLESEARGDAAGMRQAIQNCGQSSQCRARVAVDVAYLKRAGNVLILELNPSAGFSFGSTVGTARVAWRAGTALPIVQCVRVRRAGNVLSGLHVELLKISVRIKTDADCPARY